MAIYRALYPSAGDRPASRIDCAGSDRPCLYVACRYNLFLDVTDNGTIKFSHGPDVEPEDVIGDSCALDVADRGGETLEEIGRSLGLTRERIRQIAKDALLSLRIGLERIGVDEYRPADRLSWSEQTELMGFEKFSLLKELKEIEKDRREISELHQNP